MRDFLFQNLVKKKLRYLGFFDKSSTIAEMAAQCCTNRIFAFEWGCTCLSAISENSTINRILPKTRFFRLHFCRRQYRTNFNHCNVTTTDLYEVPDSVPPIHAVSSHVATDKDPSKFRSIFSDNLQPRLSGLS